MIRALRHETFDVTFNFSGTDRPTLFTALIGARWRAAYPSHRMHFWSRWLIRDWVEARDPGIPIWKRHYQTLASLGFSLASPRFELRVDESTAAAAALSVPPGAVHLSINSANPLKEWPLGHYAQLVRIVWESCPEQNFLVSAAASEREQDRLRKFLALVDDGRLRAFPGHPDIAQLAAVLQRCRLHVGPDSGVVHLAVAMGVPTISLFREQNEYKCWLPQGPAHRYFTVPCSCVDHFSGPCNAMGHAVCLAKIVPAQVAALILENGARLCTA